jgi:hypothetical protein
MPSSANTHSHIQLGRGLKEAKIALYSAFETHQRQNWNLNHQNPKQRTRNPQTRTGGTTEKEHHTAKEEHHIAKEACQRLQLEACQRLQLETCQLRLQTCTLHNPKPKSETQNPKP